MTHHLLMFVAPALVATALPMGLKAEETEQHPVFRVIFLTPSDVEPPDGVRERLAEYVDYSQCSGSIRSSAEPRKTESSFLNTSWKTSG